MSRSRLKNLEKTISLVAYSLSQEVNQRVTLSKEKDWLHVALDKPFTFRDSEIEHVFIKSKDDQALKKGGKGQFASVRIIEDIQFVDFDTPLEKTHFKFVDNVRIT